MLTNVNVTECKKYQLGIDGWSMMCEIWSTYFKNAPVRYFVCENKKFFHSTIKYLDEVIFHVHVWSGLDFYSKQLAIVSLRHFGYVPSENF